MRLFITKWDTPKMIILDVECYSNYFLLSLLNSDTGATRDFELYDGKELECKT